MRFAHVQKYLSHDDEMRLAVLARSGCQASRDRLVLAHLRMAVVLVRRMRGYRTSEEDLLQEATLGLLEAVDRFDETRGFRFSTFATYQVRARIAESAMRSESLVRMGTSAESKKMFFGLRRATSRLEQQQLPVWEVNRQLAEQFGVGVRIIEKMRAHLGGDVSLDQPSVDGDDRSSTLVDLVVDDAPGQHEHLEQVDDEKTAEHLVRNVIASLSEREQHIVRQRRMLDPPRTLEDLAAELRLSKERVRQIEQKALEKLRKRIVEQRQLQLLARRSNSEQIPPTSDDA